MVYVSLGFAFQLTEAEAYDPFWMRFMVGSIGLMSIILSQISDLFKKYFTTTLLMAMVVYNIHVFYLLYMNNFDPAYRTSLLAVVITTIIFIQSKKVHIIYNLVNIIAYTALMIYTHNLDKANIHLGMLMTIVLVFGYLKNSDSIDAYRVMKGNQNLLNTVNNNVLNAIFRIDTEFNLFYSNNYLVDILGYKDAEEKQLVQRVKEIFAGNRIIVESFAQHLSVKDLEILIKTKDGNDFWGLLSMNPVFDDDGELHFYDGTMINITDKKIAETELTLFSAAIDHTPTGVVITNRFGRINYANPYFTKLLGYQTLEIIGTKLENYGGGVSQNDNKIWSELISGRVWKGELQFQNKAGDTLTELLSVAPIKNNLGDIVNFVIVTEDITERKQTEMEIISAKEQAEEATRAKEQFLSTMSHELRTPMNSVIGIANLLLDEKPREDQVENLNILKFSASNLLAIINDILDLSKIEAGRMELINEDFDLHYTLINIKRTHALKAQEKGVDVNLTVDENLPDIIKGDSNRLNQILNNLVSNAIKFTEAGEVTISANTLEVFEKEVAIKISVTDTGIGISADQLETIFESFKQANSETSTKYGGTGLGLAITKKLIELQGGSINVTSTPGNGSCFTIELVFEKGNKTFRKKQETIAENSDHTKLNGVKVLLVDDNPINQKVAVKFLERWNANVTLAFNGIEALASIESENFDVILMDLQMPEMDGYEATRRLRELDDPYKSVIPVIALTASVMNQEKDQAFTAGMNDYICKPFNPTDLFNKLIKHSLKGKELQRRVTAPKTKKNKVNKRSSEEDSTEA